MLAELKVVAPAAADRSNLGCSRSSQASPSHPASQAFSACGTKFLSIFLPLPRLAELPGDSASSDPACAPLRSLLCVNKPNDGRFLAGLSAKCRRKSRRRSLYRQSGSGGEALCGRLKRGREDQERRYCFWMPQGHYIWLDRYEQSPLPYTHTHERIYCSF